MGIRGLILGSLTSVVLAGSLQAQSEYSARFHPESGKPCYPESLQRQRIEGGVYARFIIDTLGNIETKSFEVMRASHPLFATAVQDALPRIYYYPATIGARFSPPLGQGKPVRQVAEQYFEFRGLKPGEPDTVTTDPYCIRKPR